MISLATQLGSIVQSALARAVTASVDDSDTLNDDGRRDNFSMQQQLTQLNDAERAAADEEKKSTTPHRR